MLQIKHQGFYSLGRIRPGNVYRDDMQDIPVIMVSANPNINTLAKEAGADGVLRKPFSIKVLLDMVKNTFNDLSKRSAFPSNRIRNIEIKTKGGFFISFSITWNKVRRKLLENTGIKHEFTSYCPA